MSLGGQCGAAWAVPTTITGYDMVIYNDVEFLGARCGVQVGT